MQKMTIIYANINKISSNSFLCIAGISCKKLKDCFILQIIKDSISGTREN